MLTDSERRKLEKNAQEAHEAFEEVKANGKVTDGQMIYALTAGDFRGKWEKWLNSLKSDDEEAERRVLGTMSYAEKALVAGALERSARRRLEREGH
jgi:hypothetical protein